MKLFVRWTFAYFVAASLVNYLLRDDGLFAAFRVLISSSNAKGLLSHILPVIIFLLVISYRNSASLSEFGRRIVTAFATLTVCCIFLASFSSVKTAMPLIVEAFGQEHFFADPFLADLDKWLHFGVEPWTVTHDITHSLGLTNFAGQASVIYGLWWAIPAFYLPAIMVLLGEDKRTLRHFLSLYFFSWVFLGNIIAPAVFSAGPIFYDNIFGTERYVDLLPSMMAAGYEGSWIGRVQPLLWDAYASDNQAVGSGISAFPSLHLALATVTALYLNALSRVLGVFAWIFVAAVMFISVWCGYHYAIDGYFSIAVIVGAHVYLKRRADSRNYAQVQVPLTETVTT